jgi:glycine/D-amino acid oxidase-like deaminating enzyme
MRSSPVVRRRRVPGVEGLLVATAMNSAGVTWSAMTGCLIADIVAG